LGLAKLSLASLQSNAGMVSMEINSGEATNNSEKETNRYNLVNAQGRGTRVNQEARDRSVPAV